VSQVVLSFINNEDIDVRRHGVRRRDVLVYCSCLTDRLAILDSNGAKSAIQKAATRFFT
jgi:hypothetical protein